MNSLLKHHGNELVTKLNGINISSMLLKRLQFAANNQTTLASLYFNNKQILIQRRKARHSINLMAY